MRGTSCGSTHGSQVPALPAHSSVLLSLLVSPRPLSSSVPSWEPFVPSLFGVGAPGLSQGQHLLLSQAGQVGQEGQGPVACARAKGQPQSSGWGQPQAASLQIDETFESQLGSPGLQLTSASGSSARRQRMEQLMQITIKHLPEH